MNKNNEKLKENNEIETNNIENNDIKDNYDSLLTKINDLTKINEDLKKRVVDENELEKINKYNELLKFQKKEEEKKLSLVNNYSVEELNKILKEKQINNTENKLEKNDKEEEIDKEKLISAFKSEIN